jgi:hypothetical protein
LAELIASATGQPGQVVADTRAALWGMLTSAAPALEARGRDRWAGVQRSSTLHGWPDAHVPRSAVVAGHRLRSHAPDRRVSAAVAHQAVASIP